MVNLINANARRVGDDNYKSLLETERIYQDRAPRRRGRRSTRTRRVVGELQAKLTTNRWREVTQADLLRYMKEHAAGWTGLDAEDHRYFSARLDEFYKHSLQPTPETDAEKTREKEVKEAETTIETFIHRSSLLVDKIEAVQSRIVARDAVVELHRLSKANPDMKPDDIATQLVAKKFAQYEMLRDACSTRAWTRWSRREQRPDHPEGSRSVHRDHRDGREAQAEAEGDHGDPEARVVAATQPLRRRRRHPAEGRGHPRPREEEAAGMTTDDRVDAVTPAEPEAAQPVGPEIAPAPQGDAVRPPNAFFPTEPDLPAPKEFVPFTLDDLTTAPPDYWERLYDGYEQGTITSDEVYQQNRQRQHDEESTLLQLQREQRIAAAEAAPTGPDEREPGVPDPLGVRVGMETPLPGAATMQRDAEGNVEVSMSTTKPMPEGEENLFPLAGPSRTKNAIGWTNEDTDIVRAAVRGPLKAIDAAGSFAAYLAEQMTGMDLEHIQNAQVAETAMPGEPTTTPGMFAQGITQWLTVAGPVGAVLKSALAGAEVAAGLPQFITVTGPGGKALQVAVAGAEAGVKSFGQKILNWALTYVGADPVADFIAFAPNDPRAANIFKEFFPNAPEVATALADYLAATGDDSEMEGRLKNVLEGRLLDATVIGSFLATAKGLKLARAAASQIDLPRLSDATMAALERLPLPIPPRIVDESGQAVIPGPGAGVPPKPKVEREPRMPPKPPSLDRELTYAEMGKGSNGWYHGVGDYVKRKLGIKDGNLFLDFMAIASQGQLAGVADLNIAIDAFTRLRRGENPEDLVKELKIGNVTGPNIRRHLLARMQGMPLEKLFGVSELKVRDYRRALDGDPNVVVVDRWMWRTYYYDEWNAAKAQADAQGKNFNSWQGTVSQYRMIQERVTQEAQRLGINPSDLQAQIWAGIKLATEGPNATGLKPMRDMVKARFDKGQIQRLPGQSVASMIRSETVTRTAGILAALVAGHYAGDTDEEQAYFALLAAGLAPGGARIMAKDLANLMPAAAALRNTQVAHEGALTRAYHGTARTFSEFDPAKLDEGALFGPGFYHTEDPMVAGGRPEGAVSGELGYATPPASEFNARRFATEAEAEAFAKTVDGRVEQRARLGPQWTVYYTDPASVAAPQVRPAYLAIERPFDIDKLYSPEEVDALGVKAGLPSPQDQLALKAEIAQLEQQGARRIGIGGVETGEVSGVDSPRLWELYHQTGKPTLSEVLSETGRLLQGQAIYDELAEMLGNKAQVNIVLEQAGFDGITHIGGTITSTEPHRVWIAFQPGTGPLAV